MDKARSDQPVALPPTLHPEQRLALPLVEVLTGRGRTKIYEGVRAGTFPPPERDGPRWSRWRAGAVIDWLRNQAAATQSGPANPDTSQKVAAGKASAAKRRAKLAEGAEQ